MGGEYGNGRYKSARHHNRKASVGQVRRDGATAPDLRPCAGTARGGAVRRSCPLSTSLFRPGPHGSPENVGASWGIVARKDGAVRLEVTIPIATVSEANRRGHWGGRARRARAQRQGVAVALARHERPALPLRVTLTRIASRRLDSDNLAGALKAVRDGVAAWLGCDDSPHAPVSWSYAQETTRATRRELVRTKTAVFMKTVPACAVRLTFGPP
jgi:hypothetical protein